MRGEVTPPTTTKPKRRLDMSLSAVGSTPPTFGWFARILVLLAGIFLPVATLLFELTTGMCADVFDPVPTLVHVAAIVWVPLAYSGAWVVLLRQNSAGGVLMAVQWACGAAIGIGVFYSAWLLPLTPFAAVASVFGIGLLPLSPLLSVIVGFFVRARLRALAKAKGLKPTRWWLWSGLGFAALCGLEIPIALQNWAAVDVVHGDEATQARGLWLVRHVVSDQALLRACSRHRDSFRDWLYNGAFGAISSEECRRVYFRTTGRSAYELPTPRRWRMRENGGPRGDANEWVFDDAQGGSVVGRHLRKLDLTESRIDTTINGDAVSGYLEWTLVFRNEHAFLQREARALVQLPAGGVVSRLTLWVDGEEREAAFGGRTQTRQAYQAVVNQRRDPVLVSWKGADRVLLQCFPVQPKGGEMKVRVGITFPLLLEGPEAARFAWPQIIEQNFGVAPGLAHAIWIESRQELTTPNRAFRMDTAANGKKAFHGVLSNQEFNQPSAALRLIRSSAIERTWTRNPTDADSVIVQTFAREAVPSGPLIIVLDGARSLHPIAEELAEVLATQPSTLSVQVLVAGDRVLTCPSENPREASAWLKAQEYIGGQDATDALTEAVRRASANGGSVLWIHGAQTESWQNTSILEQTLSRRRTPLQVRTFAAVRGPNVVLERLVDYSGMRALPRVGSTKEDLARTFDDFRNGALSPVRHVATADEIGEGWVETSAHIARLWAADEVRRLLASGAANRDAAMALGAKMQLVTAATNAVVLENRQQYQAAGLEPVNANSVPTVPENTRTVLLLVAGLLIVIGLKSRAGLRPALRA